MSAAKIHWGRVWGACSSGRKLYSQVTTDALEVTCERCMRICREEIKEQLRERQAKLVGKE